MYSASIHSDIAERWEITTGGINTLIDDETFSGGLVDERERRLAINLIFNLGVELQGKNLSEMKVIICRVV